MATKKAVDGNVLLRMPKQLPRDAERTATGDGVSVNTCRYLAG